MLGIHKKTHYAYTTLLQCPHGIVDNMLKCGIIVSEFKLQSGYYIYFQINTIEKEWTSLSPHVWV